MTSFSKFITLVFIVAASNLLFPTILHAQKTNAKSTLTSENLKTVELKVIGMTCQMGCADGIDKKMKTVEGVTKSRTKLESGISKITYDESKVSVERLIAIITDKGYTAKIAEENKKQ